MAKVITLNFPNFEFHFYGTTYPNMEIEAESLKDINNIFFHGAFKNPIDLPKIYSKIDFIVATYDTTTLNPQYAEPNKIYEAIFFRTPIIVSYNSYLANKVNKLKVGFDVNALKDDEIISKIKGISQVIYDSYVSALNAIPQKEAVSDASVLFERISN